MGFLTGSKKDPTIEEQRSAEALRLTTQIEELNAQLAAKVDEEALTQEVVALKKQKADLEIQISKIEEDHERKIREVEHKVGLQQQKAEQDQAAAVREAELKVREANLETEKTQFQQQIEFQREEMQKRSDAVEGLLGQVLKRLPNHNVNETIIRSTDADPETTRAAITAGSGGGDTE